MIEFVRGTLDELTPATAVIDCNGVGYLLNISLNTFSAIQGKKDAKLYVYEAIREDAYVLYGFATKSERELFLLLISVSGIGGNSARMILSAFTPAELCDTITTENDKVLKGVKGIGLKTAQRIIVELKDKVGNIANTNGISTTAQADSAVNSKTKETREEAVSALTMLGFAPAPTSKAVNELLKENPDYTVQEVIKKALKMLK
ncbi:MAG: Holliday junction branch migration protein RuvA [Bacteroidaceae bacterium]|nr:Holliday junction branch migration protein RuvA [Bacteroidaceae bacterium]